MGAWVPKKSSFWRLRNLHGFSFFFWTKVNPGTLTDLTKDQDVEKIVFLASCRLITLRPNGGMLQNTRPTAVTLRLVWLEIWTLKRWRHNHFTAESALRTGVAGGSKILVLCHRCQGNLDHLWLSPWPIWKSEIPEIKFYPLKLNSWIFIFLG